MAENRLLSDSAEIGAALATAAERLLSARLPLIYGLVEASVEAQREAVGLADLLGAVIDPATSATHGPGMLALQQTGRVTATLGEVRNRADLIVYWGVDPERRHPGFRARYVEPAPGAPGRVEVAVDLGGNRGPEHVRERFAIAPERELEALSVLQALVRGRRVEEIRPERLGAPLEELRALAARLTGSRYAVIFQDGDPAAGRGDTVRAMAMNTLAALASEKTRLRLIGVRMPGNPVGAEKVLTWQSGYPFAVHFGRGYPRYGPGEFTAEALLARREVDAALVVGVQPSRFLSGEALEYLRRLPGVVVGSPDAEAPMHDAVVLPVASLEETPGGWYRMDGVGLRRRVPPPQRMTDAEALAALTDRVRRRMGERR